MACPNQHFYYDQYGYGYPVYTYAAYPLATYTTTPPQQPVTASTTNAVNTTNAPPPPPPTQTLEQPGIIYEQQYQHYTMPEYPSYTQYTPNCTNPNANNSNNVAVTPVDQPPQPIITVGKVNLQKPKSAPPPPAPTTSTKPVNSRLQPQNDDDMANQIKAVVEMALSNHGLSKVSVFLQILTHRYHSVSIHFCVTILILITNSDLFSGTISSSSSFTLCQGLRFGQADCITATSSSAHAKHSGKEYPDSIITIDDATVIYF